MNAAEALRIFTSSCSEVNRFTSPENIFAQFTVYGIVVQANEFNQLEPRIGVGYTSTNTDCVYAGLRFRYSARQGLGARVTRDLKSRLSAIGFPVNEWLFAPFEPDRPNNWPIWKNYVGLSQISSQSPESTELIQQMCTDLKALVSALQEIGYF